MCFDERAATWDDDPDKVARSAEVAVAIRRQVDLGDRPRTLEVGAGTGLLSRALRADLGDVVLSDSSNGMIEVAEQVIAAERLTGWSTAYANVDRGELPAGPFDLVLSQLALHHMAEPESVLRLIHAALNPGGHLAIADLDHDPDGAFHKAHGDFHGHDGFDRVRLTHWLTELRFADIQISTATTLTKDVDGEPREFPIFLATARKPG